jgi:hypothetical protein
MPQRKAKRLPGGKWKLPGRGWVRHPKAIDTLVALNGMQAGDEIVFVRNAPRSGDGHMELRGGWVYVLEENEHYDPDYGADNWGGPKEPQLLFCIKGHYFTRSNILAWRRPRAKQHS